MSDRDLLAAFRAAQVAVDLARTPADIAACKAEVLRLQHAARRS